MIRCGHNPFFIGDPWLVVLPDAEVRKNRAGIFAVNGLFL